MITIITAITQQLSVEQTSANSVLDCIGNTPLLAIDGVHAKAEFLNPSGSIKDRIARYFIERAERENLLKAGGTIVEASTGNTGIALSMIGTLKGYKVVICIAEGMSRERYQIIKSLGADVHLVPADRTDKAVELAREWGKKSGCLHMDQFSNEWNIEEHRVGTGKEIVDQMEGEIDAIVAGVGTGGTLIGIAQALKKINPAVKVFGVEPTECSLIHDFLHHREGIPAHHLIEGIADGFIPRIVQRNISLIDEVITVKGKDAIAEAQAIATHGYFVGVSSGANLLAAKEVKEKYNVKNVVTLFPDTGARYLSEAWFSR